MGFGPKTSSTDGTLSSGACAAGGCASPQGDGLGSGGFGGTATIEGSDLASVLAASPARLVPARHVLRPPFFPDPRQNIGQDKPGFAA